MKTNKYWFRKRKGLKSRDMGYGWVPISWEGWLSVGFLVLGILGIMMYFGVFNEQPVIAEIQFLFYVLVWVALFAFFARSKSKD